MPNEFHFELSFSPSLSFFLLSASLRIALSLTALNSLPESDNILLDSYLLGISNVVPPKFNKLSNWYFKNLKNLSEKIGRRLSITNGDCVMCRLNLYWLLSKIKFCTVLSIRSIGELISRSITNDYFREKGKKVKDRRIR